ncbi:MAG: hypothetical protein LBT29_08680 [Flavobacteriaceae bacterium]|nr:hypothetical protein [Flavobacteriaceae bacterium]
MTKILTSLITATVLILILSSCDRNEIPKQPETPKALQQEESMSFSRTTRATNFVDDLYAELVDKTPELKKIENDLAIYEKKEQDSLKKINNYDIKSGHYYNDDLFEVKMINDSLLKNKMYEIVKNSQGDYREKTEKITTLLKIIDKKNSSIADYHTIMKLTLTIPLIEKYQNENLPNSKTMEDLIKEQSSLIKKMNELTPKY